MTQKAIAAELLRRKMRKDPALYAEAIGMRRTPDQDKILDAVAKHDRVLIKASHGVGKTLLIGGCIINWHFDCWIPGITLSTAPTAKQLENALWKEVRAWRKFGKHMLLPKAPKMMTRPDHYAVGMTASSGEAFQGQHATTFDGGGQLIAFDEAVGIDGLIWEAAEGMMVAEGCRFIGIYNPTDATSRCFEEEMSGKYHVLQISALNHPNVAAGLRGEPVPFPGAVTVGWIRDNLNKYCTPLSAGVSKPANAFEFPDESGNGEWWVPGPWFEGRVLGIWPSSTVEQVWSDATWNRSLEGSPTIPDEPLVGGVDVARFGDDFTVIAFRRGNKLVWHERHNGWGTDQTAGRIKQLCRQLASPGEDPLKVTVNIDDDGVGGGVYDQRGEFTGWVRVSSGTAAREPEHYPNVRSELWFANAERAGEGRMDLSILDDHMRQVVRRQALAPKWKLDSQGRRVVEPKEETKKRLKKRNPDLPGGSPDDMDAINLAFYTPVRRVIYIDA